MIIANIRKAGPALIDLYYDIDRPSSLLCLASQDRRKPEKPSNSAGQTKLTGDTGDRDFSGPAWHFLGSLSNYLIGKVSWVQPCLVVFGRTRAQLRGSFSL